MRILSSIIISFLLIASSIVLAPRPIMAATSEGYWELKGTWHTDIIESQYPDTTWSAEVSDGSVSATMTVEDITDAENPKTYTYTYVYSFAITGTNRSGKERFYPGDQVEINMSLSYQVDPKILLGEAIMYAGAFNYYPPDNSIWIGNPGGSGSKTVKITVPVGEKGMETSIKIHCEGGYQPIEFTYIYEWVEATAEPIDSGATIQSVTGAVEISLDPDEQEWERVTPRTKVMVGSHIRTLRDSSVLIRFADGVVYNLKPETEIVIQQPPQGKSKIQFLFGKLWSNVKKLWKDGYIEIETSQAVAGIKGTTYVLEVDADKTVLKVIEGTVALTSKSTGQTIDVAGGQQVTADSKGLSEVVAFDTSIEQATWDKIGRESNDSILTVSVIAIGVVCCLTLFGLLAVGGVGFYYLRKRR